jgi:ribosomal protein S12 methylthiotransferase accessory factor
MTLIRLKRSITVRPSPSGVLLRSDLGTYVVEGSHAVEFLSGVIPFLDGTRTREGIADALASSYTRESVIQILSLLAQQGLIEEVDGTLDDDSRWRGQLDFLARWTDHPAEALHRIRAARVLLVGLEPWGVAAAMELAGAGVREIHILDDGVVSQADLLAVRAWTDSHLGLRRCDALRGVMATHAPHCELTTSPLVDGGADLAVVRASVDRAMSNTADGPWDMIVVAARADDLVLHDAVARASHESAIPSVYTHLDGLDAIVGPIVVPGKTACWNCARLRRLGAAAKITTALEIDAALRQSRAPLKLHTYLAPMAPHAGQLAALEVLKYLSKYTPSRLVGRILAQNMVSLDTTVHTLVRMPWCNVCGGAKAERAPTGGPVWSDRLDDSPKPHPFDALTTPSSLRATFEGVVDPRVGVVRYLIVNTPEAGEPELPVTASAILGSYIEDGACTHPASAEIGSGKGTTVVEAMLGAVGEAIERYSAARYQRSDLRRASYEELAVEGDCVDPAKIFCYADDQYARPGFPYSRFDPRQKLDWTRGWWLADDTRVWVPALPVYFNYRAPRSEQFGQVSSNGLAAGRSFDDAARRAVYELVERDAFTLTWLAQLPSRRIDLDRALDPATSEVLRQLKMCGAEVEAYALDSGLTLPVIACVALGDGDQWPGATVALGAHHDAATAARKALLEQGHVGPYVRRLMRAGDLRVPAAADDVHSLLDHAMYYVPPHRQEAFDFLRRSAGPAIPFADVQTPPSLSEYAKHLRTQGVRIAVVDVTSPDVASGPFRVVRALGEHIQPIHFGHTLAQLGNPRLHARTHCGLNRHPHPLA